MCAAGNRGTFGGRRPSAAAASDAFPCRQSGAASSMERHLANPDVIRWCRSFRLGGMGQPEGSWPDNLTDREAVERLETLMLMSCEGNQDLSNGREYKALRRALLRRTDLADVVPRFIRTQRDLGAFWAYIKAQSGQWATRREHVRDAFGPLADRVEGNSAPPISAAKWTGTRSTTEQVRVVIALGYDALAGVEALLEEQERPLHNGGPVDPERAKAIEKLKELHTELGDLLRLAEAGKPLEEKLARVRAAKDKVLRWTASPAGFALGALPLTGSSVALGVGVHYLINAIGIGSGATLGVAAMGAHVAAAGVQATRQRQEKTQ